LRDDNSVTSNAENMPYKPLSKVISIPPLAPRVDLPEPIAPAKMASLHLPHRDLIEEDERPIQFAGKRKAP